MNLRYSKNFNAALRRLSSHDRITAVHAIELFRDNPFDASLRNHALTGPMSGKRALVIGHDLRIIFTERNDYRDVTLLNIGGHADVYH